MTRRRPGWGEDLSVLISVVLSIGMVMGALASLLLWVGHG